MTKLFVVFAILFCGCVTPQTIERATYSAADCAVSTSLSCATQSIAGCIAPAVTGGGSAWKKYAVCLWEKAKSCQSNGLARCALASAVEASGFPGVGKPPEDRLLVFAKTPTGVPFQCDTTAVKSCVVDLTIESKSEAIGAVAYCYRQMCGGAK